MHRINIYSLIVLIIAAACLVLYLASGLLASKSKARQNDIGIALVGLCTLAVALFHANPIACNCFVLSLALVAGMLLSRTIGSMGAFSASLIAASVADLLSTLIGPTKWLVDQTQNPQHFAQFHGVAILQYLTLSIRLRGYLVPVIGFGDLLFFALCAFVTRRFGWPRVAVFFVPLAGILAALGVALVIVRPVPAIPFIAAAVIGYVYAASPRKCPPVGASALKPGRSVL
jgi:hypothetical protein